MNNSVELICFALEILCDYILLSSVTRLKLKDMNHPILAFTIYYFAGELLNRIFPNILGWLLLVIGFYLCVKYITKALWMIALYLTMFINIPIFFVQKIIIIIFNRFDFNNANYVALCGSIFTLISVCILCHFISFNQIYNVFIEKGFLSKFLVIHLFILYMIELGISKYTTISTIQTLPFLTAFAVLVVITDIVLLRQQQTIEKQRHNLDNFQTYQPMINELIQDIRGRQHDFDNQLNAMKMLPYTHTDYTSLKEALINYSDNITREFQESQLLKMNLTTVAGFIFSKMIQAREDRKTINIFIQSYILQSHMPEYDLIRVLGIMIDNSLEAISAGDSLSLYLEAQDDRISITTINKGNIITPEFQAKMFRPGFTTKNDDSQNHGYGLYNLKKLVEQYNGKICVSNSEAGNSTYVNFEVIV